MRFSLSFPRFSFFGCCCLWLASMGCQRSYSPVSSVPTMVAAKVIEQPLSVLFPPPARVGEGSQFHLPAVRTVQVNLSETPGRVDYYRLYRQPKSWWVIHSKSPDDEWGQTMLERPIQKIMRALQHLKPTANSELSPADSPLQLAFFTQGERFLLRIMQIPMNTTVAGLPQGGWLVYYRGDLYQQAQDGPLSVAVPAFRRALQRLRHRQGWLPLPLNSNSFSIPVAQQLAKQFSEKRKSLRRCFLKRRFPSQLGPLKMRLTFSSQGTLLKQQIVTTAHKKHSVVWCPWWHVKQWKFAPLPGQEVSFQLILPPQGP